MNKQKTTLFLSIYDKLSFKYLQDAADDLALELVISNRFFLDMWTA